MTNGVQDLDGARSQASTVFGLNHICGQSLTLSNSEIVLGHVEYNSSTKKWDFYNTPSGNKYMAAQVTKQAPVSLFFGKVLGASQFNPSGHSEAAFVRNKWCLVFDRSGSMSYDMSGNDGQYPTGPKQVTQWVWQKINGQWQYVQQTVTITYTWTGNDPPHPSLSRWSQLITATEMFLDIVATSPVENRIGLVTFGTYADTDSTSITFGTDYTPINSRLTAIGQNPLKENGSISTTNLKAGLQEAINLFQETDDLTPWNKIIVVESDGLWNTGGDPTTLIPAIQAAGITVHTIGLLSEADNSVMHQLAAQTGGQCLMANNADELNAAFTRLTQTIPVILTK